MLAIEAVTVANFRNLAQTAFSPSPRFTVISGDNGQGKSNLLEAIYAGLSSKSFRTSRIADVAPLEHAEGQAAIARVTLRIRDDAFCRQQTMALRMGLRSVSLDGKKPKTLATFATASPVVVFHPGELSLTLGPSGERRKLLDRVSLFLAPQILGHLADYQRALRSRQRLLTLQGPLARGLAEWESLMVNHAMIIMRERRRAADLLVPAALEFFRELFGEKILCTMRYDVSASEDPAVFTARLAQDRPTDARRKSAGIGPHRDDLAIALGPGAARVLASQGQHRALVLSLKAAEMSSIERVRGVRPILLLDDVSSELDEDRTARFFELLRAASGQVFLTTTRPDWVRTGAGDRLDLRMQSGVVTAL
jgi:DNA replication and repair protein RecF